MIETTFHSLILPYVLMECWLSIWTLVLMQSFMKYLVQRNQLEGKVAVGA
jgi:hypothetical protein